jgi:hypothetical protein
MNTVSQPYYLLCVRIRVLTRSRYLGGGAPCGQGRMTPMTGRAARLKPELVRLARWPKLGEQRLDEGRGRSGIDEFPGLEQCGGAKEGGETAVTGYPDSGKLAVYASPATSAMSTTASRERVV